ncbi:MAG: DUF1512 family protein [Candidatus Aenigmatarchaeota archaeon]
MIIGVLAIDIYWILFMLLIIVMSIFYPKIVIAQSLYFLNSAIEKYYISIENSKRKFLRLINPKMPANKIFEKLDFSVIEPTSLDPYGIVNKLDFIIEQSDEKIEKHIEKISNEKDLEKIKNYKLLFQILMVKHYIKKVLEHYRGTIRKYKNLQLALLIQFQLPIIDRVFRSYEKGFETILNNLPIGDGIGPLVISNLIERGDKINEVYECIVVKKRLFGKDVILVRAKGPGGRLGKIHKVLNELLKKEKNVEKIITIDAASKLEEEESGSVSDGVGVAIGGIGVEKFNIEEVAAKKDIKLDAILVKMSPEEAIQIMNPKILNNVNNVIEKIKESLEDVNKKAIIVGVGNSANVPNTKDEIEKIKLKEKIKDFWEKYGKEEERKSFIDKLFGI